MDIETRLEEVQERVAQAAQRSGRHADAVRLVAVGKRFPVSVLRRLIEAGQRRLGENRVQEAEAKAEQLGGEIEWHLVGGLQSNKARRAARLFDWIHSVDSARLARRLSGFAQEARRHLDILVQVDLAGIPGRAGVVPADLLNLLEEIGLQPQLRLRGLMTLPPATDEPAGARPYFRRLRELADEAQARGLLPERTDLSMGMSKDYVIAVEEGATLVRIGTALFGPRPPLSG